MIRPQRANPAPRLARSPEPRRPLLWSIEAFYIDGLPIGPRSHGHQWFCLLCESGTGQAPTHQQADNAAHIHWRANHNHEETTA